MGQLSPAQVTTLDEIWTDLWVGRGLASPPITDEELARDILDSWLAGVLSSQGWLADGALVDLLAVLGELDDLGEVGLLVECVVRTVGRPD
jgi:hypothetical protein